MAKTMKVRIELVAEIDVDEYEAAYGTRNAAEIREAIKWGAQSAVATAGTVVADGVLLGVDLQNA